MPTLHGIKALARTALPQPAFATLRALSRRIRELQTGPKIFADFRHFPKTAADADLGPYFDLLRGFDDTKPVALDRAHNMLIVSTILSMKPRNVVELGTGSGFFTSSIIYALEYNGTGQLTSVDNWRDTDGAEPDIVMKFRQAGVRCVHWGEEEFVHNAPDDSFDLLISDADHYNSHKWLDQYLRIVRTNGILFLHDTNNSLFPALANTAERVGRLGLPHYHFTANSRSTERCDRGLLYVINKKSQEAVHGGAAMSDVHNMSRSSRLFSVKRQLLVIPRLQLGQVLSRNWESHNGALALAHLWTGPASGLYREQGRPVNARVLRRRRAGTAFR